MGGYNSGRHGGKHTTDDMLALDVRKAQREGLLRPGYSGSFTWSQTGRTTQAIHATMQSDCELTLNYQNGSKGGGWQIMSYPVRLAWTDCHYGGQRAWWLCPGAGCGRRVAVLYGGKMFACRHCHNLAYQSQRESPEDRLARKTNKLRARLGWKAGIMNPAGGRPKGMHWTTYWRLKDSHEAQYAQIAAGIWASLGRQPPGAHQT